MVSLLTIDQQKFMNEFRMVIRHADLLFICKDYKPTAAQVEACEYAEVIARRGRIKAVTIPCAWCPKPCCTPTPFSPEYVKGQQKTFRTTMRRKKRLLPEDPSVIGVKPMTEREEKAAIKKQLSIKPKKRGA